MWRGEATEKTEQLTTSIKGLSHSLWRHLSCSNWRGVFVPGGNRGGGRSLSGAMDGLMGGDDLDEFPAFPERRM